MRLRSLRLFLLLLLVALPAAGQTQRLTLEDVHASPKYAGAFFQGGRWAADGPVVLYVRTNDDGTTDLMQVNIETDARTVLVRGLDLRATDKDGTLGIEDYAYDRSGRRLLLFTDTSPVWRYNTQGFYYVYDLDLKRVSPLGTRGAGTQLFAKFSPAGDRVGFVRNRNLYVRDLATGQETALTSDGAEGSIINGTTDWVYEEEFGLRDAWQWSPDGRQIAFLKFDESAEQMFEMVDQRGQYPVATRFRYPKVGTPNAEVRLGVIDVGTGQTRFFDTNTWQSGGDTHEYLPQFGWTPAIDGKARVWAFRMNRDQNALDLLYGDPETMQVRTVLQERRDDGWLEVETGFTDLVGGNLTYLQDGRHFIWVSERDGYRHLYLYRNDGTLVRPLTQGRWDVTGFLGADEAAGVIYFQAAKESPMERHVYRQAVNLGVAAPAATGRNRARGRTRGATSTVAAEPVRITPEAGWHDADLSRDRRFFIDTHSTLGQPPIVRLRRTDRTLVRVLEGNEALLRRLADTRRPTREFVQVPGADGQTLNALVYKPSTFDPAKKYPVLLYVYGGPGSQTVANRWGGSRALWHEYLAEELGIVVATVDGRGTGARGTAFKMAVYKKLGQLEAEDQIAAAQWFGRQPWANPARLGIWGWSYGGYMTLMSMLYGQGPQTFKVGLSVAPVTDWRQYDTIYTERFMSTPQKNARGYDAGAPTKLAANLNERQRLFIAHGDLDDNVHFQNTTQMVDALQAARKPFAMMVYPGKNHSIGGASARLHLFTTMTQFLRDNLVGDGAPGTH
jgi:dipeptidyl-peptidase 4